MNLVWAALLVLIAGCSAYMAHSLHKVWRALWEIRRLDSQTPKPPTYPHAELKHAIDELERRGQLNSLKRP